MAEVDISPLAKRLAEENNVDWRTLRGTGDDGRIVERDVLDYLARVMAGDEAADPTPEPLPEGLEEWPDGPPVASGERRPQASPMASDDRRPRTPPVASDDRRPQSTPQPSEGAAWDGDDDLLEVETAGAGDAAPGDAAPGSTGDWASGNWGRDDWGSAGSDGGPSEGKDDYFAGIGDLGGDEATETGAAGIDFGDDGQGFGFGSENEGQGFDFGVAAADEGSSFDFDAGPEAAFDTSTMEPAIDEGIFVFDDEEEAPGPAPAGPAAQAAADDLFELSGDERQAAQATTPEGSDTEHAPWEGGSATASEVDEEVAARTRSGESPWEQDDNAGASALPASDAPWTAVAEEDSTQAAAMAPTQPSSAGEYSYLDHADESLPDGVRIEEDEYRVVRSASEGAAAAATLGRTEAPRPAATGNPGGGPVSSGIVLRRDVDLTAVEEARQALSAELVDHGSLAAFLVRAAVRAGRPWPLSADGDNVGLATLSDDGVSVSVIEGASTLAFRDLVRSCQAPGAGGGEPALAVADVSALGIDEAVLGLGYPVLTVGRVIEEDGGGFHATLTLSGLTAPDSGSKFLGRVADLLAAPVRLVL